MTDETNPFNDYFKHLAETSVHIEHTADKPGFFSYDWEKFVAEKRKRSTVLFMHSFQGHLAGNEDNRLDVSRVQWSILQPIDSSDPDSAAKVVANTKAIAMKLIARMNWHKYEDPTGEHCDLLHFFNLEDVEYRSDSIYECNWTGFRIITPLADHVDLEMLTDDWLPTEEP